MPLVWKSLSHESMKPNKLKRHLVTVHKEHANKPRAFFERKRDVQFKTAMSVSERANKASFQVSYRIA